MNGFELSTFWLQGAAIRSVLAVLNDAAEARVVGGAVRNSVLGLPIGDIDIATTLTPDRVAALAGDAGFRVHETGLAHGTLTIVAKGQPFEVTTLREDVSTDGRRATVRFTTDWESDARRRDFTLNALYVDAAGHGYDYVGGYEDCVARRVHFIGDAERRIAEDHLRILRFFRFQASYGRGAPEAGDLAAVIAHRASIATLPAERILNELERLLPAPGAVDVLALMAEHDILQAVVERPLNVDCFSALAQAEQVSGRAIHPALGFLALMGFERVPFEALAERLKFSRKTLKRGLAALEAAQHMPPHSVTHLHALLYEFGSEAVTDGLVIARATNDFLVELPLMLQHTRNWRRPRFPLGGNDLLAQGGEAGVALGQRLAHLEKAWRDSDFSLTRDRLLAMDRDEREGC